MLKECGATLSDAAPLAAHVGRTLELHRTPESKPMQAVLAFIVLASLFARGAVAQTRAWTVPGSSCFSVGLGAQGVTTATGPGASFTRTYVDGSVSWERQSPGMTWHYAASGNATIFDADVPGTASMQQLVYVRTALSLWQFPTIASNSDRIAIGTSRDGSRIVAAAGSEIMVDGTVSPLGFTVLTLDVSPDGSKALVLGDSTLRVFALPSLQTLYAASGTTNFHAAAIAGDTFAVGRLGRVDVYSLGVSGGWSYTVPGVCYCDRIDLADDGSTMVAGFDFYDTNRKVQVDLVSMTTHAALQTFVSETASTTNFVGGVSISADGLTAAAGLWGDGAGPEPEIAILRSGQLLTASISGSACDVDLSGDAQKLAVGTKDVHATAGNGTGSVELWTVPPRSRRR